VPTPANSFPFTAKLIAGAPDEPGVYALWLEDDIIYFGHAKGGGATIRSCLLDHFSGVLGACTRRASHYSWELATRPAERERELIEDYRQRNRHLPYCNARR
jgi:hypothetical protein